MNGLRLKQNLRAAQLLRLTQAVHTTSCILFTHVKVLNRRQICAAVEIHLNREPTLHFFYLAYNYFLKMFHVHCSSRRNLSSLYDTVQHYR